MSEKVILILVDGMRPDSIQKCGNTYADQFLKCSQYNLEARTVYPSVTLPCHMSLSHSVIPQRHGVLTNVYTPQVRPVKSLFEKIHEAGKEIGFIYDWEELRDISKPGVLNYSHFISMNANLDSDYKNTDIACEYLMNCNPDFLFLYLGLADEIGHRCGWMSEEYLKGINMSWECIKKINEGFGNQYTIIVIADHGGHDKMHGTDEAVDMTIPVIIKSKKKIRKINEKISIIDIAPTILNLMDISVEAEWEGKSIL